MIRFFYHLIFKFVLLSSLIWIVAIGQSKILTILHTNDIHASFIPHEAFWVKETPKPLVGGFNELSFVVDSIRQVKSVTLLLDAGDVMTNVIRLPNISTKVLKVVHSLK